MNFKRLVSSLVQSRPFAFQHLRGSKTSIKMSELHLTKGSPLPPYTGKLRVYSMKFCPYAQRTLLVLDAKKIPYEVVNINLDEKPEWLKSKSPFGKVPAIEIADGLTICESLITSDYIDETYTQNPLTPRDPLKKAQDRLVLEYFNKVTTAFFKAVMKNEANKSKFNQGLENIQNELIKRGTTFFGGNSPGMVDYMMWPWVERFEVIQKYFKEFHIDESKYKTFNLWVQAMKKDPTVKIHYLEPAVHEKYLKGRMNGNPEYDFLFKTSSL